MKGQAQEAFFVFILLEDDPIAEVRENLSLSDRGIVGHYINLSPLRGNKDPVGAVLGVIQNDGAENLRF